MHRTIRAMECTTGLPASAWKELSHDTRAEIVSALCQHFEACSARVQQIMVKAGLIDEQLLRAIHSNAPEVRVSALYRAVALNIITAQALKNMYEQEQNEDVRDEIQNLMM